MLGDGFEDLTRFGVIPSQVVDLAQDDDPRILRYLDLRGSTGERPLVVESDGEPRLHVLRGGRSDRRSLVERWCVRTTVRGDGAWIGVLEPGRLHIFRPEVTPRATIRVTEIDPSLASGPMIPRLLYDVENDGLDFSIRAYLVRLLGTSIDRAVREFGLSDNDALSLVGRGLFWRFLVDRSLLGGVEPDEVCEGASSWEACLNAKARALRTFRWLDRTFNGGLLPFDRSPRHFPAEVFESVLGNIAHGATSHGQLRLPTDWAEIDFSHVPVGLLSEIYEAFSHARSPERSKGASVHYTPRRIADFVVREALESMPDVGEPRVLDPAVGAGVFLVTAFRQLAEREWARTGARPRRRALRRILSKQLRGFDIDRRALRLAELALYLSALELDPDPRPPTALRFVALRDKTLFTLPEGSLGPVPRRFLGKYDLVVGNPPWTATPREAGGGGAARDKEVWVRHSLSVVSERLGEDRSREFGLPDNNPDLPFLWRAMAWAKPGGRIAFVLHARWLFGLSSRGIRARRDLLEALHVTGILNGSDLRKTSVWPNTNAPFCLLFAVNEVSPPDAAFSFLSPRLETPHEGRQKRMRVDWSDARAIAVRELVEHPWGLKARFRGNRIAERTLRKLLDVGVPLSDVLAGLGTSLANGYQVGGSARRHRQGEAGPMVGLPDLRRAAWANLGFVVDVAALPPFELPRLLHRRDRQIYRAPLLLLRKAVPADPSVARTHRADADLAYHESFNGISFAEVGHSARSIRDYLQIQLQSSLYLFFQILTDPQYGVWVDAPHLQSVQRFPVVPFEALHSSRRQRIRGLSRQLIGKPTARLQEAIDGFAFDVYGLDEVDRDAIKDTVATALPSSEAKRRALLPPRGVERAAFVGMLQASLQHVFDASAAAVRVRQRDDLDVLPWRFVEVRVDSSAHEGESQIQLSLGRFLEVAEDEGASQVIVRPAPGVAIVGLVDRYEFWTSTRARLLANDLVEEWSDEASA